MEHNGGLDVRTRQGLAGRDGAGCSVKPPSQGALFAGKACDIRVAPASTLEWVCRPHTAPLVSAVVAVGAESEYGKGVKARRAEPGHSTVRVPC